MSEFDPTPAADFEAADRETQAWSEAGPLVRQEIGEATLNVGRCYQQLRQHPADKPAADDAQEHAALLVMEIVRAVRNGKDAQQSALDLTIRRDATLLAAERAARERLEKALRGLLELTEAREGVGLRPNAAGQQRIDAAKAALSPTGQAASTKEGE